MMTTLIFRSGLKPVCDAVLAALMKTSLLTAAICLAFLTASHAQEGQSEPVKVGVYTSPPFVQKTGTVYSGMAIDIWEQAAAGLGWSYAYQEFANYTELVNAARNGTVDVAVTNLTITEDRARKLDFTYPWYDAGMRIMVNSKAGADFFSIVEDLHHAGHLETYAMLFGLVVMATIIVTMFDRRFDPDFPKRWREGTAESFYHVMSLATSGKTSRRNLFGWIGRVWQALWMVMGVAIIAYVTSSIASVMTASHIKNSIENLSDLQGRVIGVRDGSAAHHYLQRAHFDTSPFDHIEDASNALTNGSVDAIVGDAPVLEYYAHKNSKLPIDVVGDIFHPDKYGFGFTTGSQLTRPVSLQIIRLHETGRIEEFKRKHFGSDN